MKNPKLVRAAIAAMARAYAPYSKFRVGAAIEAKSGNIYVGSNVENSSYGLTICAERSAVSAAISGGDREFVRVAIVTSPPGAKLSAGAV